MIEKQQKDGKKFQLHWTVQLILIVVLVLVIRTFLFGTIAVKGSSMEPTFQHGDFVVVNKLAYHIGTPKRGDVAICWVDSGNREENIIKRVIGLPGDEIDLRLVEDGWDWEYQLYLNGELQEEDYIPEKIYQAGSIEYPFIVPEDCYFVMGDNRNASADSREVSIGAIPKSNMEGKVFLRLYPFDAMGLIP